jgi:PPK2 family polyphosphate:nucleotide phosphotransferase
MQKAIPPPHDRHRVKPGRRLRLAAVDPADTGGVRDQDEATRELAILRERMALLQQLLWADGHWAVLCVFQAMDAGGKDGVIRHVFSGLNPAGCRVTSFKAPTAEELRHDFLWRIHRELPPHGSIGIFNRSHYEDVLIVRVHDLVPPETWKPRYERINEFERQVSASRTLVLKFFLHVSKKEQEQRLLQRLLDPKKNWKFLAGDLAERERWGDYRKAYEDALTRCSTAWAPWYAIPADRKWYRDLAVARILCHALEALPLAWPKPTPETRRLAQLARRSGRLPKG